MAHEESGWWGRNILWFAGLAISLLLSFAGAYLVRVEQRMTRIEVKVEAIQQVLYERGERITRIEGNVARLQDADAQSMMERHKLMDKSDEIYKLLLEHERRQR